MTNLDAPREKLSSNELVRDVHGKLKALLNSIEINSGKFAAGVFAVLTLSGNANAQDTIALNTANTTTPGISTPSNTLNPIWEKEFKAGVTKEQRGVWSEEKKEAYDDWLEQDGNRKRMANQEKQAKDGALAVANQKLARDNAILAEIAGKLQQLRK